MNFLKICLAIFSLPTKVLENHKDTSVPLLFRRSLIHSNSSIILRPMTIPKPEHFVGAPGILRETRTGCIKGAGYYSTDKKAALSSCCVNE